MYRVLQFGEKSARQSRYETQKKQVVFAVREQDQAREIMHKPSAALSTWLLGRCCHFPMDDVTSHYSAVQRGREVLRAPSVASAATSWLARWKPTRRIRCCSIRREVATGLASFVLASIRLVPGLRWADGWIGPCFMDYGCAGGCTWQAIDNNATFSSVTFGRQSVGVWSKSPVAWPCRNVLEFTRVCEDSVVTFHFIRCPL